MTEPLSATDLARAAPARATGVVVVHLDRIAANWRALRDLVAPAECAAVVKADAYGLGAARVIPALAGAGCRTFFVATLDEAIAARALVPSANVLVLDGLVAGSGADMLASGAIPVISSLPQAVEWAGLGDRKSKRLQCALHVDTGLNRLGLSAREVQSLIGDMHLIDRIDVRLVMSHLACADDPNSPKSTQQREVFERLLPMLPSVPLSLAASDGLMLGQPYHYDLVRPGYALYGGQAFRGGRTPVQPAVELHVKVLQVRDVAPGQTVGYGASWSPPSLSRIAVIGAGYADGLFRHLSYANDRVIEPREKTAQAMAARSPSSGGEAGPAFRPVAWVAIRGQFAPIVGRVSMDLVTIDITDIDGDVAPGDSVEAIGPHIPIEVLGASAGTIGYEVLTSLGRRFHRIYTGSA